MNVQSIIDKYYPQENELKRIYMTHARKVADFALEMAARHPELRLDSVFVEEAALLHDLGIFLTDAPRIYCFGDRPYICHGFMGAELLRAEGLEHHALVCERHTGVGIGKEQIEKNGWPIPVHDMLPISAEEQLICFADKFYSKTRFLEERRTLSQVVDSMKKISADAVSKIMEWNEMFGPY